MKHTIDRFVGTCTMYFKLTPKYFYYVISSVQESKMYNNSHNNNDIFFLHIFTTVFMNSVQLFICSRES